MTPTTRTMIKLQQIVSLTCSGAARNVLLSIAATSLDFSGTASSERVPGRAPLLGVTVSETFGNGRKSTSTLLTSIHRHRARPRWSE